MIAEAGIVKIQVRIMLLAIPQRTAEKRLVVPTPIMAPAIVWVVLTGIPIAVALKSVMAPAVSALKPPMGFKWVSFTPMVLIIFIPPERVPKAMTDKASNCTQKGTLISVYGYRYSCTKCMFRVVYNNMAIIPIVFCASFPPCPILKQAEESNCPTR